MHRASTAMSHGELKLGFEQIDHTFHATLTKRRKAPYVRTANTNRGSSQGERFEDVGPAAKTAINKDRYASACGLYDVGKTFDSTSSGLESSAAVIRNNDSVGTVLNAEFGILGGFDSLYDYLHSRGVL